MTAVFDVIADDLAIKGYAIADQFLSQSEVHSIINLPDFKRGVENFRKAGIGKNSDLQINESVRGDYIQWIDKVKAPPELMVYLHRLDDLTQHLNQALFLSMKDYEVHMTIYPVGTFYKRHLDQFKKDDHRKLSVICYLNPGWTHDNGGQLRMYVDDNVQEIFPEAGRLVCFRSDQIEHEVLPANRERLSLTGWILDQHAELRHL